MYMKQPRRGIMRRGEEPGWQARQDGGRSRESGAGFGMSLASELVLEQG